MTHSYFEHNAKQPERPASDTIEWEEIPPEALREPPKPEGIEVVEWQSPR